MEQSRYKQSGALDRVVSNPIPLPKASAVVRFMEKVQIQPGGCWPWQGSVDKTTGYGWFRHSETKAAHRASYLLFVGPLPPESTVDHICGNRACVNPDHLEPVPHAENLHRAAGRWTECDRLHPSTATRIATKASGRVHCQECHRIRELNRRAKARLPHA